MNTLESGLHKETKKSQLIDRYMFSHQDHWIFWWLCRVIYIISNWYFKYYKKYVRNSGSTYLTKNVLMLIEQALINEIKNLRKLWTKMKYTFVKTLYSFLESEFCAKKPMTKISKDFQLQFFWHFIIWSYNSWLWCLDLTSLKMAK